MVAAPSTSTTSATPRAEGRQQALPGRRAHPCRRDRARDPAQLVAILRDEPLIRDAVEEAFRTIEDDRPRREADLAAIERDLRSTQSALDRYLQAFENGSMPADVCGPRVEELNGRLAALDARRAELAHDRESFTAPTAEELEQHVAQVEEVIEHGDRHKIKLVLQAYVNEITVESRDALYPSFAIPVSPPEGQMELAGLEPATSWVRSRRNASPAFATLRHLAHDAKMPPSGSPASSSARRRYLTKP